MNSPKKRCKCQSSVYNYHKILKVFVREAYAAHLISENPYQNFKLDRGKRVARKFLTKEELAKLETKQIDDMWAHPIIIGGMHKS